MRKDREMSNHLDIIKDAIINGKHTHIEDMVKIAIEDNADLDEIINDAMIGAMDVVGRKFSNSEIFVPEMLVAAVTMKKGLDIIKPLLIDGTIKSKGTIIMCTVKGDIHDIGKNLVIIILQGAGFDVIDLGVDITVEKLIQKVKEVKPDILGMSALLTTTMLEMKKVIDALESNGLRNSIKVMVGGAPMTEEFSKKIGADGYGRDSTEAVELARKFVAEN
jgi:5-methyltetrahydrofolate--homocysteine methyltransferase